MNWTRTPQRFVSKGLDLNHPVDLMPEGKFPYLNNIRSFQEGRLEVRPGLAKVNSTPLADPNIHSIFRMNDYVAADFVRFLGAGTKLYSGQSTFSLIDSGYSGNPLSICPFIPAKSVSDWAYIADSSRLRKANSSGTNYSMGITPPIVIPTAELLAPANVVPTGSDATSPFNVTGTWANFGNAQSVIFNPSGHDGFNGGRLIGVSIGTIHYISGSTGWANIATSGGNWNDIVAGARILIGTGGSGTSTPTGNKEYAVVEEVHKIYPASGVTIGQIIYDSGTTGLCTIEPSVAMAGVVRNSMLELASEFVRIISVTNGANGISSFRCSTSGTHSPGDAITPPAQGDLWIYLTGTHAAGEFLWQNIQYCQVQSINGAGAGLITNNTASPYNLGVAGNRPVTPDDYFHMSFWATDSAFLVQLQITLDVDSGTTGTHQSTDGTQNAYVLNLKGSDLAQYITNNQTDDNLRPGTIQDLLQAQTNVPYPTPIIPPSKLGSGATSTPVDVASTAGSNPPVAPLNATTGQLTTGATQWTELRIPLSTFVRIGADQTTDLTGVRAIELDLIITQFVNFAVGGMYVGGTFGPDVGNNLTPFLYRYRYRSSTIGCVSLPGPSLRSGVTAYRQGIQLVATASSDPQVDKIDWERLGGSNVSVDGVPDWHYLGTCSNSSPTIIDDQFSAAIVVNSPFATDTYQPFTLVSTPLALQATVAGTAIHVTTGAVNTNMVVGTEVLVNGVLTEVYASPTSSTLFHVADSMGSGTGVTVEIPEPTLTGQPLRNMWGPFANCLFAVGNPLAVNNLYFTKGGDPDSSSDANYITISSPSESLMNGCVYDSKNYVFSDKKMYQIVPSSGANPFDYVEVMNGKGLVSPWALTVGPRIWFVANDGVYEVGGGTAPAMISGDIRPLFPQGDKATGFPTNGYQPIDTTQTIKLTYHNHYLLLDFIDLQGANNTLVYDTLAQAWYFDTYLQGGPSIITHASEASLSGNGDLVNLLASDNGGTLYSVLGTTDGVFDIPWEIDTPAFNGGDFRAVKQFGDQVFDTDLQGQTATITPWVNNYETSLAAFTLTNAVRAISPPITLPIDTFARNLAWKITGTQIAPYTRVYSWEPAWMIRPEITGNRVTDWDDAEYEGNKFLQGFVLEADTFGQARTVDIQVDFQTAATVSVDHSGHLMKPYVVDPAFTGHLFRIVPHDSDAWALYGVKWVWEPAPEFVTYWETQTTTHDVDGYQFIKDGYIALNSTAPVTLQVVVDNTVFLVTLPSTGGLYQKLYFIVPGLPSGRQPKGKLFKYILSSGAPFQLFQKDSEVYIHSWISSPAPFQNGGYTVHHPFGDTSRIHGASI